MRVLFFTEFFPEKEGGKITGGVESRVLFTALELAKSGHKVMIMTSKLKGSLGFEVWSSGLEIYRVGPERLYTQSGQIITRLLFTLAALYKSLFINYDIVDAGNAVVYYAASTSALLKRKKSVHWVPDIVGFKDWLKPQGLIGAVIATVLEYTLIIFPAGKIIALSHTTKNKLLKMGISDDKIAVVYPGVKEIKSVRKVPKIFTVVSVNRLAMQKRVDVVIKAVNLIKNTKYIVIGDGPERKGLQKLGPKTIFLGNVPNQTVMENYLKASVFVLASEVEGFGIVTMEALSCGLPFINSDILVHQEIAKVSQAGLLFRTGDADDLAEKIKLLMKDKKLYSQLSNNALKFAKKYTWRYCAKQTEKIYNQ